jgi:hypothetical protein
VKALAERVLTLRELTVQPCRASSSCFLPKWDNVLLAFADRTRVHPEAYRRVVIRSNGDVAQTFLVDGLVTGVWSSSLPPTREAPRASSHAQGV